MAEVNPYTEEQMNILGKKVDKVNIPYQTGYYQGLANLRAWFCFGLWINIRCFGICTVRNFAKGLYRRNYRIDTILKIWKKKQF